MKKFMMLAMMMVASATSFAGKSDALKAITKSKDYAEAAQLLKSNFDQLADNAEKAEAYNHLVDLAMQKVTKESKAYTENQAYAQIKSDKKVEVDMIGLCDAFINALNAGYECNKYDQLPNAKGKVAPKFAEKNIQLLWTNRQFLVTKGDEYRQAEDYANAIKYWMPYLDSTMEPLFAEQNFDAEKETIEQVSYLTSWMALRLKKNDIALKYSQIGMKGTKYKSQCESIMLSALSSDLKTKQDTLNYIARLKGLYEKEPDSELYINALYNVYGELKDVNAQESLLKGVLDKNPNHFIALADMGILYMGKNDFKTAIEYYRKAIALRDNVTVFYYMGTSLCMLAQDEKTSETEKKNLYKEAIQVFDKCKELDPNKEQINWGYGRQNAYYNFYGPDSDEFKQAEADYKN